MILEHARNTSANIADQVLASIRKKNRKNNELTQWRLDTFKPILEVWKRLSIFRIYPKHKFWETKHTVEETLFSFDGDEDEPVGVFLTFEDHKEKNRRSICTLSAKKDAVKNEYTILHRRYSIAINEDGDVSHHFLGSRDLTTDYAIILLLEQIEAMNIDPDATEEIQD